MKRIVVTSAVALATLIGGGCASDEQIACEALVDAWVAYYDRCGYGAVGTVIHDRTDAERHLFGASEACGELPPGAFRDYRALRDVCAPVLGATIACDAGTLPPECENQILITLD